ncbi:hypothetical protein [Vibrio nigripulchritudo]|uniref:hypothetical protein n=1 Tax=Vibrio nigripulchritudo TaxID=28173 RepID=UPI0019096287|nr:hypothetical protein [Vibrio nigripulchritudo]
MYISYSSNSLNSGSYIGGKPMLPSGLAIPAHPKTGNSMTFFFQILMPENHTWNGKLISVFCVTDDYVSDKMLPEMVTYNEYGYDVGSSFIKSNQDYFRIIVSDYNSCSIREDYKEVLTYQPLMISESEQSSFGFIGDKPLWLLEDETPLTLDSSNHFDFLFQINLDIDFPKLDTSPRQTIENFEASSGTRDSYIDDYSLFAGNSVFFFGEKQSQLIYMVLQS